MNLGVGLHSYGFTDGLLAILGWIAFAHLTLIAIASLVPTSLWRGYQEDEILAAAQSQPQAQDSDSNTASKKSAKKNRNR